MLQSIREKSHGWVAWVIFSAISITFVFWGVHNYSDSSSSDIVATVNHTDIHRSQLNNAYDRLRAQRQFQLGNAVNADMEQLLKQQALRQLIITHVLSSAALAEGLRYSLKQTVENIQAIPNFQMDGHFSPQKFKEVLANLNYSENEFISNIQSAMLINQMRVGLLSSAFALGSEAESSLKLIKQKRDLQYLIIPTKSLQQQTSVTTQAIADYYNQHQAEFSLPEQARIEYLELTLADIKAKLHFSDAQLQDFYAANNALFTQQGQLQPFTKVKKQVADAMGQQKAEQLFAEQSEKLANLTFSNSSSLAEAANALALSIRSTEFFTQQGSTSGITANPSVVTAAFSDDVLKQGNNSQIIELNPQHVVVLRSKAHKPVSVQPLAAVRANIEEKLRANLAKQNAKQLADNIVVGLAKGTDINPLLKPYKLAWLMKTKVGRIDNTVPSQILNKAFQLPVANASQPKAAAVILSSGDFAVVKVNAIHQDNSAITATEQRIYNEQLQQLYGQLDYGLYAESQFAKAKVNIKK